MYDDARRALAEAAGKPFAMVLWTVDMHSPYRDGDGPNDWNAEFFPPDVRGNPDRESAFQTYLKGIWPPGQVHRTFGRRPRGAELSMTPSLPSLATMENRSAITAC